MSRGTAALSVKVFSEDGSKQAHDTVVALFKKMALLVDGGCATHRIDFEPANDREREAVIGNAFKEKSKRKLIDLVRSIATKLLESNGFVVHHFDGDETWSRRTKSENLRLYEEKVIPAVRSAMQALAKPPPSETETERRMKRLLLLVPFWEIEAWLYHNTEEAVRICHERYAGRHVDRFEAWSQDRGLLDELPNPKDAVCLKSEHNFALASAAFPARAASEVGKSFAASVDRLRGCEDLVEGLARTRDVP